MSKESYIFKYEILESGRPVIYVRKIRAMNVQEAYARFQYWKSHRKNRDIAPIERHWLDPVTHGGIADDNEG